MLTNITELVFILDMSGSMSSLTKDTIGGFNSYIYNLYRLRKDVNVSLILFNTGCKRIWSHQPIYSCKRISYLDFIPQGGTAICDALGLSIESMKRHCHNLGDGNVPKTVEFIITSDGEDNSSSLYNKRTVRHMIQDMTNKKGWQFSFAGTNIDSFKTSLEYGFKIYNIAYIDSGSVGYYRLFECLTTKSTKTLTLATYNQSPSLYDYYSQTRTSE